MTPTPFNTWLTRRQLLARAGLGVGAVALERKSPSAMAQEVTPHQPLRERADRIGFRIGSLYSLDRRFLSADERERHQEVVASEFNLAVIDGGPLHWGGYGTLRPAPDSFDFSGPDEAVAFAKTHNMEVEGHHLAWGRQEALPSWLLEGGYAPDALMEVLRDHVRTVVGRYMGLIHRWSVINEPFEADGSYKTGPDRWGWWNDNSPWSDGVDPDYIEIAFREARAADPDAVLILNDHGNEQLNPKSDALYFLATRLLDKGVPINGVGMQMHLPGAEGLPDRASVVANMARFKQDLGLDVFVTEFDVNVSPARGAIPGATAAERFEAQAWVYGEMLRACLESGACPAFSVFGFWDPTSWLMDQYAEADPLLFTSDWQAKPAYFALQEVLSAAAPGVPAPRTVPPEPAALP